MSNLLDRLNSMSVERRSYTLQTLTQHLSQAEQYEHLHALLTYDWMRIRVENDGHYGGFLKDVDLASDSVHQAEHPQVELYIRYALMQSSIKSLATNVPAILFPLFVEAGMWSFNEAVIMALQSRGEKHRCAALIRLAQIANLSGTQRRSVFMEVLKVEWPYEREKNQEHLLRTVAPFLPLDIFPEALHLARNLHNASLRQAAISALAPYFPFQQRAAVFEEALTLARKFESFQERAEALTRLAPMLTPDLVAEALKQISVNQSELSRYTCLQRIAGYIPSELHSQAITIAQSALDKGRLAHFLGLLANQYVLIETTLLHSNGHQLGPIPKSAAPMLPTKLRDLELTQALQIVRSEIEDKLEQAELLCMLSAFMPNLQEEALDLIITHGRQRQVSIEFLAAHLKSELHDKIIASLLEFSSPYDRSDVILNLAPHLRPYHLNQLLQRSSEIVSGRGAQLEIVGTLIHFLPEPQYTEWAKEAYRLASSINDQLTREATVSKFVAYSSNNTQKLDTLAEAIASPYKLEANQKRFLARRLETAIKHRIVDLVNWPFINSLCKFVPLLDNEQIETMINALIQQIDWYDYHIDPFIAYFIGELAAYIPNSFMLKVCIFTVSRFNNKTWGEHVYLCTLADLAAYLPSSLLPRVLGSLSTIQNDIRRTCAYIALTPYLHSVFHSKHKQTNLLENIYELKYLAFLRDSKELDFGELINEVKKIPDSSSRIWLFLSLLPYIPAKYQDEVVVEGLKATGIHSHTGGLEQFALLRTSQFIHLTQFEHIITVLENAINIGRGNLREEILKIFVDRLLALPNEAKYSEKWRGMLRKLAEQRRPEFLSDLVLFLPVIERLGNKKSLSGVVQAILEISNWWP